MEAPEQESPSRASYSSHHASLRHLLALRFHTLAIASDAAGEIGIRRRLLRASQVSIPRPPRALESLAQTQPPDSLLPPDVATRCPGERRRAELADRSRRRKAHGADRAGGGAGSEEGGGGAAASGQDRRGRPGVGPRGVGGMGEPAEGIHAGARVFAEPPLQLAPPRRRIPRQHVVADRSRHYGRG